VAYAGAVVMNEIWSLCWPWLQACSTLSKPSHSCCVFSHDRTIDSSASATLEYFIEVDTPYFRGHRLTVQLDYLYAYRDAFGMPEKITDFPKVKAEISFL
jgi:hypothetical protein